MPALDRDPQRQLPVLLSIALQAIASADDLMTKSFNLMDHPSAKGFSQSGEEPTPSNRSTNALRCPVCLHRRANMAVADNFVELIVGQFEEALCFAVTVVSQPFIAKNRILEGNRYRRTITPHDIAFGRRTVFGSGKRGKEPVGLLFKKR
jgi:hypothetical protein